MPDTADREIFRRQLAEILAGRQGAMPAAGPVPPAPSPLEQGAVRRPRPGAPSLAQGAPRHAMTGLPSLTLEDAPDPLELVQRGAENTAKALAAQPAGMESLEGVAAAKSLGKGAALRAALARMDDEALLEHFSGLGLVRGRAPMRQAADPDEAEALYDELVARGQNVIRDDQGRLMMISPPVSNQEKDFYGSGPMVPNPFATNPETGLPYRAGQPSEQLRDSRFALGRDPGTGTLSGLPTFDAINAQHVTHDAAAGRAAAFGAGASGGQTPVPAAPDSQALHARLGAVFARRHGRPPTPEEAYRLWAELNGMRGGPRR